MSELPEENHNSNDNPLDSKSPDSGQRLHKISRARTRLIVCFWTLPVYVVAVWLLLNNGQSVDTLMWIYMAIYALFAVDMSRQRCPNCGEQFFVKTILLNLLTRQCVHCGESFRDTKPGAGE